MSTFCDICYNNVQYLIKCKLCKQGQCSACSIHIDKCPFCRDEFYTDLQKYKIQSLKRQLMDFIRMVKHSSPENKKLVLKELCWLSVRNRKTMALPVFKELREHIRGFLKQHKHEIPLFTRCVYSIF